MPVCVVAVKVYKKSSPNGKVTVYLGKRDFIDHLDYVDPIDGVVVIDNDYLKGRKIFGQLATTYRYGREEDEVMGLKFSKEIILTKNQIVPSTTDKLELTSVQDRLVKKFGANAFPFTYRFPGRPRKFENIVLTPLYKNIRQITTAEFKDIIDLLRYIPPEHHDFFKSLSHAQNVDE